MEKYFFKILRYLKRKLSSFYTICFISILLATTIVSINYSLLVSELSSTIKKEAYIAAVESSTEKIITLAELYNHKLKDMYQRIDTDLFDRIVKDLESIPLKEKVQLRKKIEEIASSEQVIISLINYPSTKVELSSDSSLLKVSLKDNHPNIKSEMDQLKLNQANFRFAWNSFTKDVLLFYTKLRQDKNYIWSIRKNLGKQRSFVDIIKNLQARGIDRDPFVKKIGVYSKDQLTNHNITGVKLPKTLKNLDFKEKCNSLSYCIVWRQIKRPQGNFVSDQFIRYLGIEYSAKKTING